jgi:tetratricopeptide (TPR) repeat protein
LLAHVKCKARAAGWLEDEVYPDTIASDFGSVSGLSYQGQLWHHAFICDGFEKGASWSSHKKMTIKLTTEHLQDLLIGFVCVFVVGVFAWSSEPGFLDTFNDGPQDSYYNLLVRGFQSGHLNVAREAPSGLAALSNPYDPTASDVYVWDMRHLCREMSYYHGKLYLYFGVTPALVLFWPYAWLTGCYLSHQVATVLFFSVGFLAAAWLLRSIWRRHFPQVTVWGVVAGLLAMSFCTGILEILSYCQVHEVAKSCAFAFTMLSLAAMWRVLDDSKHVAIWMAIASLAYGLAVGARPSMLFGAIILLVPAVQRRSGLLFLSAVIPISAVGIGLAIYNFQRFGSPFEFGWRYQLTNFDNNTARQFSPRYLWSNFIFYFVDGRAVTASAVPYGFGPPDSGILLNYPIVWFALAVALAWKNLRWFVIALLFLFVTCAVTICLFYGGESRYEIDFLPALMLLAVIGFFALERNPKILTRVVGSLLLAYSIFFNAFAAVKAHAVNNFLTGNSLVNGDRLDEGFGHLQTALKLEPRNAWFHVGLGKAFFQAGQLNDAVFEFEKAIEINPQFAEAEFDLGKTFLQLGQTDAAVDHFYKAFEIGPHYAESREAAENNNLAWELVVSPGAGNRDGEIAIKLAQVACEKTQYKETVLVGTLSAAYAEAGRFDDAILASEKACELARQHGETNLLKNNEELLRLFEHHQPYRATNSTAAETSVEAPSAR